MNIVNGDFIIAGRMHCQSLSATCNNHCLRAIGGTIVLAIVVALVVIGIVVVIVFINARRSMRMVCARVVGNVHCGCVVGRCSNEQCCVPTNV